VKLALITEIIAPYRVPVFNALARHPGLDLHVIFLAENDARRRQWRIYKEEIEFSHEVLPSYRGSMGGRDILLNWGLGSALSNCDPAAIVCGGYNYAASWISQTWARRKGVPFFAWVESNRRDLRTHSRWRELLKKKFLNGCSGFLVAGQSSFDYLNSYHLPREKIFTAPNAVDSDLFASCANAARENNDVRRRLRLPERFFLFVGRMVRDKGIFDLLEAYRLLPADIRRGVGLVFAGDGPDRAQLERAAELIHPGNIVFSGFVQRDDLPAYYGSADLFILPTHSDAWGLVVNEAMACGLPIICTAAAGCVEDLVTDHWNGRIVAPYDVHQLTAALVELATNIALRSVMGTRSRERIAAYSPQTCADGIAAAVLSLRPSPAGRMLHAC